MTKAIFSTRPVNKKLMRITARLDNVNLPTVILPRDAVLYEAFIGMLSVVVVHAKDEIKTWYDFIEHEIVYSVTFYEKNHETASTDISSMLRMLENYQAWL